MDSSVAGEEGAVLLCELLPAEPPVYSQLLTLPLTHTFSLALTLTKVNNYLALTHGI
jgi:hypothetical protein